MRTAWQPLIVTAIVVGAAISVLGCSDSTPAEGPVTVTPAPPGQPWDTLAEWHLFRDAPAQLPAPGVEPYTVISPLYSDYTHKRRFAWLPEGTQVSYDQDAIWELPQGAIVIKTFSYLNDLRDPSLGEQLLETRLLVHEPEGWVGHVYVWNAEQTAAVREVAGENIAATWIHTDGQQRSLSYGVPNTNECQDCHGEPPDLGPRGLRTAQLNTDSDIAGSLENQIDRLAALGWFTEAPPPAVERPTLQDPFGEAPLFERVRSYLDSNCGHCHTEGGFASESSLLLSYGFTDPTVHDGANWGECKVPTSAGGATCGLTYDVVPGDPDSSIMICRVASDEPEVRMPPLASKMPHDEGVALLRAWIEALGDQGCTSP